MFVRVSRFADAGRGAPGRLCLRGERAELRVAGCVRWGLGACIGVR